MNSIRCVAALLVASVITACGSPFGGDSSSPQPTEGLYPNWPSLLNDFRFKWTSTPGIDVTTGVAMVVRAYLESYEVASMTFDAADVYPGFERATPKNAPREGNYQFQLVNIRPLGPPITATTNDARPKYGFTIFHFLELSPIDNGFRALVCSGNYARFMESRSHPGKFVSVSASDEDGQPFPRNSSGVSSFQIELTQSDPRASSDVRAEVRAAQQGPMPAPDVDVFGNWFVTAAGASFWGPKNDPRSFHPEWNERCEAAMPTPRTERLAIMTGFKDQPPPHGQAEPGWPARAQ